VKSSAALFGTAIAACIAACSETTAAPEDAVDVRLGGDTTVFDTTNGAYANAAANLKGDRLDQFSFGHSVFKRNWVTAPATTEDMDGLGPLFNQRACSSCHSRDGRAEPLDPSGAMLGMLLRISVPGADEHGGPLGDPIYGTQIQPNAILGVPAAAKPRVTYEEKPGTYGDGTPFSLRIPRYTVDGWGYGEPSPDLMISPRVAPVVIGLGLLEAVPESAILEGVKTNDPDGVRGHANHVWDVARGVTAIGRFGWKANVPSVLQQTAGAFLGDIGITSSLFPTEACTAPMTECSAATSGGAPEVDDARLKATVLYMQTLAVPARRGASDAKALRGEALFDSMGCASCHRTTFETGAFPDVPEVAFQTIHPYTDLLVHDMGEELADGRPDYEASGTEWRTPPLWGIGLLSTVNGHEFLLHDGRARGLAEAILWHGGEATAARERFRLAPAADRDALLAFLRSL